MCEYEKNILNEEQIQALKFIEDNDNVLITGGAGVGKSFLINYYKQKNSDKNILVCAPTGVASLNVNGATLHRVFQIPVHLLTPKEPLNNFVYVAKMLRRVDIIIIDEISMCRQDVFEYVCRYIDYENKDRLNNVYRQGTSTIKLILVGDFYQLPPVINNQEKDIFYKLYNNTDGFAFQSEAWKRLNIKTFELKTIVRQTDKEFASVLNQIRKGDVSDLDYLNYNKNQDYINNAIFLSPTNAVADGINLNKLNELQSESKTYIMHKSGNVSKIRKTDLVVDEEITLKKGCRVMIVINDPEEMYSNGSLGTVKSLSNDSVIVKLDTGSEVIIQEHTFDIINYSASGTDDNPQLKKSIIASYTQLPIKLAYAITIHKSQGQTYDSVNIDISRIFANGQLYVALSRCKSIENTHFSGYLGNGKVKVSKTVLNYFEGYNA